MARDLMAGDYPLA